MTILSRLSLFILLIAQLSFLPSSWAGIFKDEQDMADSCDAAKSLKEEISPGKIIVKNQGSAIWSENLSATPIGKTGDASTSTILSCAHNFLLWDEKNNRQELSKDKEAINVVFWGGNRILPYRQIQ